MALPTALPSVVRSGRDFASTTSKRDQASEKTRFIYFQPLISFASGTERVEANGDCVATIIDAYQIDVARYAIGKFAV